MFDIKYNPKEKNIRKKSKENTIVKTVPNQRLIQAKLDH